MCRLFTWLLAVIIWVNSSYAVASMPTNKDGLFICTLMGLEWLEGKNSEPEPTLKPPCQQCIFNDMVEYVEPDLFAYEYILSIAERAVLEKHIQYKAHDHSRFLSRAPPCFFKLIHLET